LSAAADASRRHYADATAATPPAATLMPPLSLPLR